MKLALTLIALFAVTSPGRAQTSPGTRHLVGDRIGSHWKMEDPATRTVTDTITLTFQGRDGGPVYSVDFITRHPLAEPLVGGSLARASPLAHFRTMPRVQS